MYTCALRPTGVYGDGDELIRDFYKQCVQRGGVVVQGVPEHIEHGRVYVGEAGEHQQRALCFLFRPLKGPKAEAPLSGLSRGRNPVHAGGGVSRGEGGGNPVTSSHLAPSSGFR